MNYQIGEQAVKWNHELKMIQAGMRNHKLKMIQVGMGIESKKDQAWLRVLLQIQFEKQGEGWHGCHSRGGRCLRVHGGSRKEQGCDEGGMAKPYKLNLQSFTEPIGHD